jgi:hypothetical protein
METQLSIAKNNELRLTKVLTAGQLIDLYKKNARNLRDLLLIGASILFFSCTLYYAIATSKNISSPSADSKLISQHIKTRNN